MTKDVVYLIIVLSIWINNCWEWSDLDVKWSGEKRRKEVSVMVSDPKGVLALFGPINWRFLRRSRMLLKKFELEKWTIPF